VSAVPEPCGSAVLVQTIYADGYRGRAVTFHGQLRTAGVASHAGLYLAAGWPADPPGARLRDRDGDPAAIRLLVEWHLPMARARAARPVDRSAG
jgi:hypothetical protein